jgi:protease secretion system outer membrane protein
MKKLVVASCLAIALAASIQAGHAQTGGSNLLDHFEKAKQFDPAFQGALAERDGNVIASKVAASALFPEVRYSQSQLETENSARSTVTVSQPVFNVDRYSTFRERGPRAVIADATYQTREQELAQRLFKAVAELVRARESLALNKAKIDTLDQQAKSAKRTFELGTGTLTDVRDAQVRLDQARAGDLTLRARQAAAERAFAAITGYAPLPNAFALGNQKPQVALQSLDEYMMQASSNNPSLIVARQNERIAEIGVTRAKGAWLPTVAASATRTKTSVASNSYVGVALAFPLSAGSYYQVSGAVASATRAAESTRDVEQKTKLEVQRLRDLVEAGRYETEIRMESIRSAELSVEANEKSFSGGIRTRLDILNSIQTLYQTKEEYLNATVTLAENLLSLYLQMAMPIPDALKQVQSVLFTS